MRSHLWHGPAGTRLHPRWFPQRLFERTQLGALWILPALRLCPTGEAAADALARMKADGIKVVDVDPAFYAALQKAAEPSYKQFDGIAAKAGLDGPAMVKEYKALYELLAKK